MNEHPYDVATVALKAHGSQPRGKNWQCPAHDDRDPSLTVTRFPDRVLIHCHAGCSIDKVLAPLGLEPSDLFVGNGHRQGQLFPASQYSPVGVDVLCKLPPGAERTFIVASALGRFVPLSGGRERVRSGREIVAVIVEARHRRAVLLTLGISQGSLRNDIARWKEWGVAHGCSTRVLTILVRNSEACPVCKASLVGDVLDSKASLVGDAQTPPASLVGDAFVPEVAATHDGFVIGVRDVMAGVRALEWLQEDTPRRRR